MTKYQAVSLNKTIELFQLRREDSFKNLRSIQWKINGATLSIPCNAIRGASCYAGCPEGAYRVLKRVDFFFFFFVVYTNRYINLFIKLSPLLLGMYCFDCLQQKQANQNPFLSLILRGRGPTHPYLCDVNASFDIFIKDGLSRAILF